MVPKSNCRESERILHTSHDIRLHRLEIRVRAGNTDWDEFLSSLIDNAAISETLVEGNGFEDNSQYVFFSNIRAFGRSFAVPESILRKLCGIHRAVDKSEKRFVVLGAAVRTAEIPRFPAILLGRSWHGKVPGVEYVTQDARTAKDDAMIPVLEYDFYARETYFPRNLFHINDIVPRAHDTRWNTICVTFSRINDGETGWFTIHLPYASFSPKYAVASVKSIVDSAFEKQPVS